jgi:hypothetical protein
LHFLPGKPANRNENIYNCLTAAGLKAKQKRSRQKKANEKTSVKIIKK